MGFPSHFKKKKQFCHENISTEFGSLTTQWRKKLNLEISEFQEVAQIRDAKDAFEVLLGGTASGALRQTRFEIGAGWLVLSPHPSAHSLCSSGVCLSDLLEVWSWEQLKTSAFSPLSFLMKQETCLCTRNVLFKSLLLKFLFHLIVCVAYPSVSEAFLQKSSCEGSCQDACSSS